MKKLLLADTDAINSEVLKTALEGDGYSVLRIQSAEQWNEISHRKSFRIIVMDESFLGISKHLFSISKDVFKTFEKASIIIMTEYPELVEKRYKFPKKARFLLKPFQAEEMFSLLRQIVFEEELAVA